MSNRYRARWNWAFSIVLIITATAFAGVASIAVAAYGQQLITDSTRNPGYLTYDYVDYGVKIDYPDTWEKEEFAFDDRHFTIHPGHLPGLPVQVFQPSEFDIRPDNKEIVVLGLYPPFLEGQDVPDTKFLVIAEKVGFGQNLEDRVQAYISDKQARINDAGAGSPQEIRYDVIEQKDGTLSGLHAITLVTETRWNWNADTGNYDSASRSMRIFTIHDDRMYILYYDVPLEKYDMYLGEVSAMASSFTITSTGLQKMLGAGTVLVGAAGVSGFLVLKARRNRNSLTGLFMANMRRLLPAALGIEILCISAAEIGGNSGLYMFGFNWQGVGYSYLLVYALAGFTTFAAILGRYRGGKSSIDALETNESGADRHNHSCDCCSILEEEAANISFFQGLKLTLVSFGRGLRRLAHFHKEQDKRQILKTSLILLVTAESGCIATAATIDFVLYQYSMIISIPLSLAAGTIAVAAPHAFRQAKKTLRKNKDDTIGQIPSDSSSSSLVKIKGIKESEHK